MLPGKATLAASLLLLLMGCRQLVGIEPRQVFDGSTSAAAFPACGLETRSAACASCLTMNCCAQAHQCVADRPCASTEACVQTCAAGDSACQLGCSKKWDPVSATQAQLRDCRDGCAEACGPWDCLGNVRWQVPDTIPNPIAVRATTMCGGCSPTQGTAFLGGVRVRVCSVADPQCLSALASADSDERGNVALTLNSQNSPAAVYLELHKDGYLDDLLMLNTPPLSSHFDVGVVHMETPADVDQIARNLNTTPATIYNPSLAVVKVRVGNCNLQRSAGIDLTWAGQGGATIVPLDNSQWDAIAMNMPIPTNETIRVVARKSTSTSTSPNTSTEPLVASVNLIVRPAAVTLAPFVTPTPSTSGP